MTTILPPTEYSHGPLRIEFNAQTGDWTGLSFRGDNLMIRGSRSGFWIKTDCGDVPSFTVRSQHAVKLPSGLEVVIEYTCEAIPGLRVWQIFDLYGDAGRIERWVHVAASPHNPVHIESATLTIDGLTAGAPESTGVSIPGSLLRPGTPLGASSLSECRIHEPIVALARTEPPLHVAAIPAAEKNRARLSIANNQQRITIAHEFLVDADADGVETLSLAEQVLKVQNKGWQDAMAAIGKLVGQREIAPIGWDNETMLPWIMDSLHNGSLSGCDVQRIIGEFLLARPPQTAIDFGVTDATQNPLAALLAQVITNQARFPQAASPALCLIERRDLARALIAVNFSDEPLTIDGETRRAATSAGGALPGRIEPWAIVIARIEDDPR